MRGFSILSVIVVVAAAAVVIWLGVSLVSGPREEVMQKEPEVPISTENPATPAEMVAYAGGLLAGSPAASPLLDFNKKDYDAALKTNKLIVLYFYANWCPICKVEVASALYPAFNGLTAGDVIGFRVNYNDGQTDANERSLASQFGVAYQHTKVFVKNSQRILKSPESWGKERYLSEIEKALAQ